MAVFSYESTSLSINFSSNFEEKNVDSYNESSAIYIVDEDFGSIADNITAQEDYQLVTNTDILGRETIDYGLITINETLVPYGPINIGDNDFANLKLIKIGIIDGVTFTILGEAKIFTTPIEKGSGTLTISGTSGDPIITLSHVGSGSLFEFVGSSESTAANPPDSTLLIRISGSAGYQFFLNNAATTEGSLILKGESVTIFKLSHIAKGKLDIEGAVAESITPAPHIGSGRLFAFTGSSESVTRDPIDLTTLLKVSGEASYKLTSNYLGEVNIDVEGSGTTIFRLKHIGSGSLFEFSSTTESIAVNPPEETVLFRLIGFAIEKNTEAYVGSGSLFEFSSATESIAFNPPEETVLFRFTGLAVEKNTEAYVGSGSLFEFSSTTESITVNPPEETVLFRFTGLAVEKNTEAYVGSGSLFEFIGSSESVTRDEDIITLFRISGEASYKLTSNYLGEVNIDVEGSATTIFRLKHIGSGSLFEFSSTTESITVNPPEETVLFRFTGFAIEKNTEAYVGSGSLFEFSSATESIAFNPPEETVLFKISGFAIEKNTEAYVGSGSLFEFSSTTESIAFNPPEETVLFRFTGLAVEKNTEAYVGSGSLFEFSSATESIAFNPPEETVLFKFVGNVTETAARSQLGSGSLFAITGSHEAIGVVPKIAGILFNLFGFVQESITPAPEIGSGLVNLEGFSIDEKIVFVSAKPTKIILI